MPRNKQAELHKEARERQAKKAVNPSADLIDICANKDTSAKMKKDEKRSRRFCLVSYINPNTLEEFLKRCEWVQHWAMCTHDSDLKEDGSLKEVHTHILLYTYNAKTASAIKKVFDRYSAEITACGDEPQNTLCQIMHDSGYQWRYLIHEDDKDKHQYEAIQRICDDYSYWSKLNRSCGMNDSANNVGLAMFDDVLAGVGTYEMVTRYGKEYMYHAKQIKGCVVDMLSEQSRGTFGGLLDMCKFALADSTYTEEQLTLFYSMLVYVQAKFAENQNNLEVQMYLKA